MAEKKEGAKAKKKLPKGRHLSALKRERQNNKLNARNRSNRSALRTAVKVARTELSAESVKKAVSALDKAASKGIIPKRRAARLISRLHTHVNKAA